ncbi:MAG: PhzF family phenazine biosynthesis protein [Nocardioidaceae bacterium]
MRRREPEILHYAAFTDDPAGGNQAGVVLDASGLDDSAQLAIAADLGYSETAFLTEPPQGPGERGRSFTVRYFSPVAEVPFCGHATVAAAVAVAERIGPGDLLFTTQAGPIPVTVAAGRGTGALHAILTTAEPYVVPASQADVEEALTALDWPSADLDPALPPRIAYAGARHLVLAAATRDRLARLDYDFDRLTVLMHRLDLTTVQLVWRESDTVFHVRDPFPVGGVVEDAATGAAAGAFGAYARELALVTPPVTLTLHQGYDLGRPSRLTVELRTDDGRVRVGGSATALTAD